MHTSAPQGKRVRIKLKSGRVIVAKFLERTSTHVVTEDGKFAKKDIKSFSILR